jgi:DNA (cytosine-5)-methyltransferase 1
VIFQSGVRRLTPTECERLQGFPDGWTATGATRAVYSNPETLSDEAEIIGWKKVLQSDSARYRQLGNAVAVPVARWIGERILQAIMTIR